MAEKTYWWVSVGGNPCEPAVVIGEPGAREAFTFGCPDAFKLDEEGCPVVLVEEMDAAPLTPKQQKAQWALWEKQRARMGFTGHGYRRF